MKEERKIITKLLEVEQMNTYKILAEFFARKFYEKEFDKEEQKRFNDFVTNQETAVLYKSLQPKIVKKGTLQKNSVPKFIYLYQFINV